MECASNDSKNRAAAGFIQRFQNMTQCSAGIGEDPQQAETRYFRNIGNAWFFAFVYTDALLATIVKATKNSPLFHFFLAASNASVSTNLAATKVASNAYGAPYAKNAHFRSGGSVRFPACWEISQAL